MRNVKISPGDNWNSLDIKYEFDDKIKFDNKQINTADGISLNLSNSLSNNIDIKNNNSSMLMLSDLCQVSDLVELDVGFDRYPEQFTTTLIFDATPVLTTTSKYLKILPRADDSDTRDLIFGDTVIDGMSYNSFYFLQEETDNDIYFSVNLLNDTQLTINHNDNYADVFLTLTDDNTLEFHTGDAGVARENQKFDYMMDKNNGDLILMTHTPSGRSYLGTENDEIVAISPSTESPKYPPSSLIKIIPYHKRSSELRIINNWVSYKTSGDLNNLNVSESNSYSNLFNNYLLNTQYTNITGSEMNVDITQLKNQLTPEYNSTRNSPFPNFIDCDHREYDRIFSGTNQVRGSDDLFLGYNSYTTDIILPTDSITYFHTPQIMYPVARLNVNDSGLIEAGALGGDSPVLSDKLFKKAANYKYNSPHGAPSDEETGVWLCTWLRSGVDTPWDVDVEYGENINVSFDDSVYKSLSNNKGVKPTTNRQIWKEVPEEKAAWVDRYYNPSKFSTQQALELTTQYTKYTSKFEFISSTLSAEGNYVFDKKSDITFEPGSLYAYYRIGSNENDTIIKTLDGKMIHQGQAPAYKHDRTIFNNTQQSLSLDGTLYIETNSLNNTRSSDYTISVNLSIDDWSQPIGGQIIGNYTNHGVGLFNKMHTTPFIIVPTVSSTEIFNTDFDSILSIPVSAEQVVHGIGTENIFILNKVNNIYNISQYDHTGLLVENMLLPEINSTISHINITDDSLYVLDVTNSIIKYNINNELQEQTFLPRPSGVIGGSQTTSSKTYVELFDDYTYKINCDTYSMDLSGSIWYKKNNTIYKYTPSERLGVNASYSNTINETFVSLVADERVNGNDGNSIIIIGDGASSLGALVDEWNQLNPANKVRVISGDSSLSIILDSSSQIRLTGGVNTGGATDTLALSASDCDIVGIKTDLDNNVWVLLEDDQQTKIIKLDSKRNILFTESLSSIDSTLQYSMTGQNYMDIISEFRAGEYINNVIIMNKSSTSDDTLKLTKIKTTGEFVSTQTKSNVNLNGVNIHNLSNITNFETTTRMCKDMINNNKITLRTRLQSYFDTDRTYTQNMSFDISKMSPGYHNIISSFDSNTGITTLYCDGELKQILRSNDTQTGAAYKFSKTIHDPLIIGTEPFLNNITLSDHLGIANYSSINKVQVNNLRIYNDNLSFHKLRALSRETKEIQPITLSIPTGKRSYLDQVKQVYKHRTPGRKSEDININVHSNTLTGDDIRNKINLNIFDSISINLPGNSNIRSINWIDNE